MAGQLTMEKYPDKIRRVIYLDKESKKKFIFFTNALTISPVMVAELYHNRWQIELFFKWIKQHLKIKKFWGTSENAVRIQIYSAIIAYCMMAIVQKKMNIERSIYEMLQIVSISLTDTTNLKDLFAKPNYNIVNELAKFVLIVKLYNNRPELLPDSNVSKNRVKDMQQDIKEALDRAISKNPKLKSTIIATTGISL